MLDAAPDGMPLLLRAPPLPAQGGRSLITRACGEVELDRLCAGRSPMVRGEFCAGALPGRFEPKPCGARPRSVELPCASQVRPLPARARLLFAPGPFVERLPGIAEGGRFCESSRCREVIPELAPELACALPGRFGNWPLILMLLCTPELPTWPFALALRAPFIVRTGSREAPCAGAVRAMTARF